MKHFNARLCIVILSIIVDVVIGQNICDADDVCFGGPRDKCVTCGSWCQATCDNPNPRGLCPQACNPYGCECTEGTVRAPNGKCVTLSECPSVN